MRDTRPIVSVMTGAAGRTNGPEDMRDLLRTFVAALHHAYLGAGAFLAPAERAALPLVAAPRLCVAVAGARYLHLIATSDRLPSPHGQEVEEHDEDGDLRWSVRFFDPVVLPELGLIDESSGPAAADVRRVLGIADVVYQLSVAPGSGLTPHHAQHAGTGLANQHAGAARDAQTLRAAWPRRGETIDEFAVAERLGLHEAMRLLARSLAPGDAGVDAAVTAGDDEQVRRALVAASRSDAASPMGAARAVKATR